jgi:hypothetical protein
MRITRNLFKLEKAAIKRLQRLRFLYSKINTNVIPSQKQILMSYLLIDLLNTWAQFNRHFYLSCILEPKTTNGNKVSSLISIRVGKTPQDAIGLLIQSIHPRKNPPSSGVWHRRDEPNWHDINVIFSGCNLLNTSKSGDVNSTLSFNFPVFKDLAVFRNYFAHKNQSTENAAKLIAPKYLISPLLNPLEIAMSVPPGRTNPLFIDWIDELELSVLKMCE